MSVKNEISPLHVGDMALRVRVQWRALQGCAVGVPPVRPVVVNTQAVWIVAVSEDGERVTWTDFTLGRDGREYRHTSHRRELLNLEALADELSPANAPLPELAALEPNPAAAA